MVSFPFENDELNLDDHGTIGQEAVGGRILRTYVQPQYSQPHRDS